jgi:hypothetical protein
MVFPILDARRDATVPLNGTRGPKAPRATVAGEGGRQMQYVFSGWKPLNATDEYVVV